MTLNQARTLGVIYTFIVGILCLIPLIFLAEMVIINGYIVDKKELVTDDGKEVLYNFNNMEIQSQNIIKEGYKHYFDMAGGIVLLFSVLRGGKIGEEVLIAKSSIASMKHKGILTRVLFLSFFWTTIIWVIYFLIIQKGMNYQFGNLFIDGLIFIIIRFALINGMSELFATSFLYKLLSYHKH